MNWNGCNVVLLSKMILSLLRDKKKLLHVQYKRGIFYIHIICWIDALLFIFFSAKNVLRTRMALDVKTRVATVRTWNGVITWAEIVPSDVMPVCMESNVTKVFNDIYYDEIQLCFTSIFIYKINVLFYIILCWFRVSTRTVRHQLWPDMSF